MTILITCGPSYEPIDGVRRITNLSTGALGIAMANYFVAQQHRVICVRGEGSTCCTPCQAQEIRPFGTNDDLARLLQDEAGKQRIDAVLHAAALCDYKVEEVQNVAGATLSSRKFATRDGQLRLILAPATKVLPAMRAWFPSACIVGWKYELGGTRDEAFAKAWQQIQECGTDACVLNGSAYGPGFALCQRAGEVQTCDGVAELCSALRGVIETKTNPVLRP